MLSAITLNVIQIWYTFLFFLEGEGIPDMHPERNFERAYGVYIP
jgi:hypothetical protein